MKNRILQAVFLSLAFVITDASAALITFNLSAKITSVNNGAPGSALAGLSVNDIVNATVTYENDVPITFTNPDGWAVQSAGQFTGLSTFTVIAGS